MILQEPLSIFIKIILCIFILAIKMRRTGYYHLGKNASKINECVWNGEEVHMECRKCVNLRYITG